jgi:ribosomal peptide maturation radical SAM protein 1
MDILFAVLPFADLEHPAIGVSLLNAQLNRHGFSATIRYFNFDLAERIGPELYGWIAERSDLLLLDTSTPAVSLVGEWFFADFVFPGRVPGEDEYIAKFLMPEPGSRQLIGKIIEARRYRQEFVDSCVRQIQEHSPRVVGFTSTFHQTCACLAVASRLKRDADPPLIIFGGGNCEGEMGYQLIRSFPWIDYVCTGEGDEAVPLFLRRLLRDRDPRSVPGILNRQDENPTTPVPVRDMDALPIPDYSSYFERLRRSPLGGQISPKLLAETARGCWWGEKHHCTFCGLNGHTMSFRSKSPRRVIQELSCLSKTYGLNRIDCVDNILDLKYIQTLFPELVRSRLEVELFYETKSNLRLEQLRALRDGGVHCLQPGIESFSNQILRLMRKGCTALQNLQLLRWCDELGIAVIWNLIYGFPHESPSEYERMAAIIPLVTHLQPPSFCIRVRMDRFSPLFKDSEQFGLADVRPMSAYSYVFPLERHELARLAYFFEFNYTDGRNPAEYARGLIHELGRWSHLSNSAARPQLDLFQARQMVLISDTRPCAVKPTHVLSGLPAKIYLLCDTAQSVAGVVRKLGDSVAEQEVRVVLEGLRAAMLMLEMEGQYLSLAVTRNRSQQSEADDREAARTLSVAEIRPPWVLERKRP